MRRIPEVVRRPMPALDGLRGIAIVLVLLHNLCSIEGDGALAHTLDSVLGFGWVGVQLFFVLSGFLITGILRDALGEPGYFRSFLTRRVLRIFPLYYLVLALYLLVLRPFLPVPLQPPPGAHAFYWLYLSNWLPAEKVIPTLPHLWSLAVEEQFYLAWPLVVFCFRDRKLAAVCVALTLGAVAVRVAIRWGGLPAEIAYENTFARMDALTLGAMAAVVVRDARWIDALVPRLRQLGIALAGVLVVLTAVTHGIARKGWFMQSAGYSLLAIVFTLLVTIAAIAPAFEDAGLKRALHRGLTHPALRWLGKYSYGIYIFHLPLRFVAVWLLGDETVLHRGGLSRELSLVMLFAAAVAAASMVLAVLSFHLFEKRFLAWKDRLAPRAPAPV